MTPTQIVLIALSLAAALMGFAIRSPMCTGISIGLAIASAVVPLCRGVFGS